MPFRDLMAGHIQRDRCFVRDQGVTAPQTDEYGPGKYASFHRFILHEFDGELAGGDAICFLRKTERHRSGVALRGTPLVDMHDGNHDFLQCRSAVDVPHAGSWFA